MILNLRPFLTAALLAATAVAAATGPEVPPAPGGPSGGPFGGQGGGWRHKEFRPGPGPGHGPGRGQDPPDTFAPADGHPPEGHIAGHSAHPPQPGGREDEDGTGPPGPVFRPMAADAGTSLAPGSIRRAALDELRTVPLLETKVRAMISLQMDRRRLQEEKRRAAMDARRGGDPKNLGRFHEVVRLEDELTSRQQRLLAETVRDADAIRAQVAARRGAVAARMAALETSVAAGNDSANPADPGRTRSGPFSPQAIELRWMSRLNFVYEAVEERLANLESNPRQPDWARPILRIVLNPNGFGNPDGWHPPGPARPEDDGTAPRRPPPDEANAPPPPPDDELHRRMDALARDRDEMARKLERMERRMQEMQRRADGGSAAPGGQTADHTTAARERQSPD